MCQCFVKGRGVRFVIERGGKRRGAGERTCVYSVCDVSDLFCGRLQR